jgi:hypothetical protein
MGDTSLHQAIESVHVYLNEQLNTVDDPRFKCILAAQSRSLKNTIDFSDGVSRDDASALLELIRSGPWAGIQINLLSAALDKAVAKSDRSPIKDRKPQSVDNIEGFFTDDLWAKALDVSKTRIARMTDIVSFMFRMDFTNPDPKVKQRLVAILSLTDGWIRDNQTNAKVALGELTDVLNKHRPPKGASQRPHLVDYPVDPTSACDAIDGFAERVYGRSDGPSNIPPYSCNDIDDVVRNSVLRWSNKQVRDDAPKHGAPVLPVHQQYWGRPPPMGRQMTSPTLAVEGPHDAANQQMQMMHGMMQMQQQQMMSMMGGCMPMPGMMPMFGGGFGAAGYGGGAMAGFGGGAPWQMPPGGSPPGGYFPGARGAFGDNRPPVDRHGGRAAIGNGEGAARGGQNEGQRGPPPPGHGHALEDDATDHADANNEGDELDSVEGLLAKDKVKKATGNAKAKADSPAVVTPKAKAKGTPMAKAPAAAVAKPTIKRPASAATGVPHWGPEDSRFQIMCRTGIEGAGQSHAIKYEIAGGKANAIKLANQWVAKKTKELGIKKGK